MIKLVKHVLTLTPGNFLNNVQELPWKCEVCGRTFYRYTNKATCLGVKI